MRYSFRQHISYLIMLIIMCIDQGDGRWKERDKENIRQDIMAYKNIKEKLEREIEAYYDEYPNEWPKGDDIDRVHQKYFTNIFSANTKATKDKSDKVLDEHTFSLVTTEINVYSDSNEQTTQRSDHQRVSDPKVFNKEQKKYSGWPKFEDLLLDIGRKYDWKNDRWIKVKLKPKTNGSKADKITAREENSIHSFNEKHKFSYKIVKLNKSKSRRNVVVAVSAVR